jgi:hypothetical protein
MAGAAGGALQTAQRIGAAIGTALLATVYYHVLTDGGHDFAAAVSAALLCAAGLMFLALLITVGELVVERRAGVSPAPLGGTGAAAVPAPRTPHETGTS